MSGDAYTAYYQELCDRINKVIRDKWPGSLDCELNPYARAREKNAEMMTKLTAEEEEINSLWLNLAPLEQFKEACTAWGRTVLEIHRVFVMEMREREA